jgi:HEAT repeat protein
MISKVFERVLKIYPDELKIFLWVTSILFIMRVSGILLNNYAQTAFLKRFGVEYLPQVFLINAILVFFVGNFIGVLMDRFRVSRVLSGLFLFYAFIVLTIRALIPYDIPSLYPILFVLKTQVTLTLPLLYWNLMNDFFTTRQSKRLFTLITAGGALGISLGSLFTSKLGQLVYVDNLLIVFSVGFIFTALLVEQIDRVVQAPIQPKSSRRKKKKGVGLIAGFKEMSQYSRKSPLIKYLVIMMMVPNIILPILNYQFNVIVDLTYVTETRTLEFFGFFRGITNVLTFALLMISGRIITRVGIGTSLLFHPINYFLVFLSLFFRFDIIIGMYARFSTETLKATLNNPARAVLFNFFPANIRGKLRAFLRTTVVRGASLTGAGLLLLLKGVIATNALSLLALPFALIWVIANIFFRKNYTRILLEFLQEKQIDWRRLGDVDLSELLNDRKTMGILRKGLSEGRGREAIAFAEILSQVQYLGLGKEIAMALPGKEPEVQASLLKMLTPDNGREAVAELKKAFSQAGPAAWPHYIEAMVRVNPNFFLDELSALSKNENPAVASAALTATLIGFYRSEDPDVISQGRRSVMEMITSGSSEDFKGALKVLAEVPEPDLIETMKVAAKNEDHSIRGLAVEAMGNLDDPEGLEKIREALKDPHMKVRIAAIAVLGKKHGNTYLHDLIEKLGEEEPEVRKAAADAILLLREEAKESLIRALALPNRILRNEILGLFDQMEIQEFELIKTLEGELAGAYTNLARIELLKKTKEDPSLAILLDHLKETNEESLNTVFSILDVQDPEARVRILQRSLRSKDKKDVANAIEALESYLHPRIGRVLIPLIDEIPAQEKLDLARKRLSLSFPREQGAQEVLDKLLDEDDPVTRMCVLYFIGGEGLNGRLIPKIEAISEEQDSRLREAALFVLRKMGSINGSKEETEAMLNTMEKIIHLKKIQVFTGLQVRELTAISSITKEMEYAKDAAIIREGDMGEVLYLIIEGEVSVIQDHGKPSERVLAKIQSENYFGEMALFDSQPRSATIVANKPTRVLELGKFEFEEIMQEFPQIAISICQVFSERLREQHDRYKNLQESSPSAPSS